MDPDETQGLDPAAYELHGFVQKTDQGGAVLERYGCHRAHLAVLANPAVAEQPRRSHAAEMYALITARIEGRLPADREQVIIDGTQITRIPIAELVRLRGLYAEQLRAELRPDLSPIRTVVTRDAV